MAVDMLRIVTHEVGPHERHVFRCAQLLGQGPLDEPHDAVSHETAVLPVGVLRQSAKGQHGVAGDGQVADRIEQRAVEIEDNQFRIHRTGLLFFRIFHPAAATISDMSGLTRLKTQ